MSPWSSKLESRLYFTTLLKEEVGSRRAPLQKSLAKNLVSFLKKQTGVWGAYKALLWEADVEESLQEVTHLQWVFPRLQGEELHFYKAEKFERSVLGFLEPSLSGATFFSPDSITGYLIPGLAFNRDGVRLGRGKGYYDRLLKNYKGKKVGVAFSQQLWDGALPNEEHDIKMDYVITNEEVLLC
jgi:5-formyltetrahydrofolate cyclo-ligase